MPLAILIGTIVALLLIAALALSIVALRRVVPTNMTHIIQSKRTTTSYGKGKDAGNVYYQWPPFLPGLGVLVSEFPESVFDISLAGYEAYDVGRLPFMVDVKAFFRIEDSDTAAHRVSSFTELRDQLHAVLQGAVRRILSTNALELIMQDRSKLGDDFTQEVNNQLKEWGVTTVKAIEFMDIRDSQGSQVIANIMAKEKSRIDRESRVAVAENVRDAELKEIDARRTVDVQRQDAEQQVGIRTAEKDKLVGIAKEQSRQEVLVQEQTSVERDMAVKRTEAILDAEIVKDVAQVKASQDREVALVVADASKKTAIINAEALKEQTQLRAQGDLAAAKNNAEGIQATGEAKAKAEEALLMAPVTAQITLAKEIGDNDNYQAYLINLEQIRAGQVVGVELAKGIGQADVKIIANSGDIQGGVASVGDLFSAKGGTNLTALLAGLSQTPEGKAIVDRLGGKTAEPQALPVGRKPDKMAQAAG